MRSRMSVRITSSVFPIETYPEGSTSSVSYTHLDVLILDGVDDYASYIQKGVFADLSGAIDETALVPSVGQAFLQDGEVCVFPARFQVPVLFGDAGFVEKLTSLDALRSEVHQWAPRPDVTVEDESYYTPLDDRCV